MKGRLMDKMREKGAAAEPRLRLSFPGCSYDENHRPEIGKCQKGRQRLHRWLETHWGHESRLFRICLVPSFPSIFVSLYSFAILFSVYLHPLHLSLCSFPFFFHSFHHRIPSRFSFHRLPFSLLFCDPFLSSFPYRVLTMLVISISRNLPSSLLIAAPFSLWYLLRFIPLCSFLLFSHVECRMCEKMVLSFFFVFVISHISPFFPCVFPFSPHFFRMISLTWFLLQLDLSVSVDFHVVNRK